MRREYGAGKVRVLVPFACSVIRDQVPVAQPIDHEERKQIAAARRICSTLNIPWDDFHLQALDAARRYPGRVTKAIALTWDDHKRKLIPSDATPAQWFERFMQHAEAAP
ncbi:MAG TPA: hypothetical protein VJS69_02510 [Candidatus Krumholzibacteria bacterium]|nr:hypothetical protein [Candidatus Krumholzibacteria bacterium]